jgi:hypothetical protein
MLYFFNKSMNLAISWFEWPIEKIVLIVSPRKEELILYYYVVLLFLMNYLVF